MNGQEVYQKYLALKRHFDQSSDYDFFTYNGKTNASFDSYLKRKDKMFFEKLARKFSKDDEIIDYMVSNFIHGDAWIKDMLMPEGVKKYDDHRKVIESLSYTFKEDLKKIQGKCPHLNDAISILPGEYQPLIFKMLYGKHLHVETVMILNNLFRFIPGLLKQLSGDPVFMKHITIMKKYRPFLKFNPSEYSLMVSEIFT